MADDEKQKAEEQAPDADSAAEETGTAEPTPDAGAASDTDSAAAETETAGLAAEPASDAEEPEETDADAPEAEASDAGAAPDADSAAAETETAGLAAEPAPDAEEPENADTAQEKPARPAKAGDDEEVPFKERLRLERSRSGGPAKPQRSPEERAVERAEHRRAAAAGRTRHRRRSREKRGEPGSGTPPAKREPAPHKVRQGLVVSSKADKTITVRIDTARRHPMYEKVVRRGNTLTAHDETNQASEGDLVTVVETRPLSRTKRWRLLEIVERAR